VKYTYNIYENENHLPILHKFWKQLAELIFCPKYFLTYCCRRLKVRQVHIYAYMAAIVHNIIYA